VSCENHERVARPRPGRPKKPRPPNHHHVKLPTAPVPGRSKPIGWTETCPAITTDGGRNGHAFDYRNRSGRSCCSLIGVGHAHC
jgi:hypothetical protein